MMNGWTELPGPAGARVMPPHDDCSCPGRTARAAGRWPHEIKLTYGVLLKERHF